jgi:hypothetical protein
MLEGGSFLLFTGSSRHEADLLAAQFDLKLITWFEV